MTFKVLDFKCALITDGAGGIGRAIAEYFLSQGKKVIIVGRTEFILQATSNELNDVPYYVLDIGDTTAIPDFCLRITQEHPELDCIVNNAGVQRPLDVNKMPPEEFLSKADQELSTNIFGPMHLAINLLPHLKSHSVAGAGAVIVNVSSVLGISPFSIINPVYNGSKTWVHSWSINLRTQLEKEGMNVRVVEIVPPSVGRNLHCERQNPEALTVEEFMEEIVSQLKEDKDVVSAGMGHDLVERWYGVFGEDYKKAEGK